MFAPFPETSSVPDGSSRFLSSLPELPNSLQQIPDGTYEVLSIWRFNLEQNPLTSRTTPGKIFFIDFPARLVH